MKTTISELPRDLIEEILARVPMKSTRAVVRLTCKSWNTLSKSQMSLAKRHIEKVARGGTVSSESTMIALMNKSLYLMRFDNDHPSIELKGKLSCLNEQVKISKVFHCQGLLLCVLEDDTRLVVWNPYCGQTTWIKTRWYPHHRNGLDLFHYALGYEDKKSGRSFKLLRFIDYTRYIDHHFPYKYKKQFSWYEIYKFDSGLWTTLDVTPNWFISRPEFGVSLKGNTYWYAAMMEGNPNHIICFDFTRESFGPLLPLPSRVKNHYAYIRTSIYCVREEKLLALSTVYEHYESEYPGEVQIWITTKIEATEMSWSNVFKFRTMRYPMRYPVDIRNIGCFYFIGNFIDEEKKVAMGFSLEHKTLVTFGEAGYLSSESVLLDFEASLMMNDDNKFCWPRLCSYVPSLVQIKKPTRRKRRRQNSLEKRQFAQNMLKLFASEVRIR